MPRPPASWTEEELERDAGEARRLFVRERRAALRTSERTLYAKLLAEQTKIVRELLVASDDLRALDGTTLEERKFLEVARYLAVPPISLDDLDTLTGAPFRNWVKQKTDGSKDRPTPRQFEDVAKIVGSCFDRGRAKWLAGTKRPSPAARDAFAAGAAAIQATNRLVTVRRNVRARKQENKTRKAIKAAGHEPQDGLSGTLEDPVKEMDPGTYLETSRLLDRTSMDVPVRLLDGHGTGLEFVAVECKVSNSAANSRKRLLEVTGKAKKWDDSGVLYKFRTAAVLAGVFDLGRLVEAQKGGVMIFWEHRLQDLTEYLRA